MRRAVRDVDKGLWLRGGLGSRDPYTVGNLKVTKFQDSISCLPITKKTKGRYSLSPKLRNPFKDNQPAKLSP